MAVGNEPGSLPWDLPKPDPLDGDLFAQPPAHRYRYLGDRLTAPHLRGAACSPVRRGDGRCIVGRGAAKVIFAGETVPRVVIRRRLRIVKPP